MEYRYIFLVWSVQCLCYIFLVCPCLLSIAIFRYAVTDKEPVFDAASMVKLGADVIVLNDSLTNMPGVCPVFLLIYILLDIDSLIAN